MSKTPNDEAYEDGVRDGKEGRFLDDLCHSFEDLMPGRDERDEIYDKGYSYGSEHRYDDEE